MDLLYEDLIEGAELLQFKPEYARRKDGTESPSDISLQEKVQP